MQARQRGKPGKRGKPGEQGSRLLPQEPGAMRQRCSGTAEPLPYTGTGDRFVGSTTLKNGEVARAGV